MKVWNLRILKNKIGAKIYYSKRTREILRSLNYQNDERQFVPLLNTPEHGNLGDHAIALGELFFLQDTLPNLKVIEISGHHLRFDKNRVIRLLDKSDVILVHGGGYLGNLWPREEELFREIVERFASKKIFLFPQTIYFDKTHGGDQEEQISRSIYTSHQMIHFFARENQSFKLLKEGFKLERVYLMPDMALYLTFKRDVLGVLAHFKPKNMAIFCMRNDREKRVLNNLTSQEIELLVRKRNYEVEYTDTVINNLVRPHERLNRVAEIFGKFSESRLIVTDRLHGMIFSFITGTPCIALDNLSGKVRSFHETWFKNVSFIKFISTPSEVEESLEMLLKLGEEDIASELELAKKKFKLHFEELASLLKREIRW